MKPFPILCTALLLVALSITGLAQQKKSPPRTSAGAIPAGVLLRIIKAEDERRWSDDLSGLLADQDANVRRRAALVAGRIGDERAVPLLADMVLMDSDVEVRQMSAFALGEIESPGGGYALTSVLKNTSAPGRARAVEALGKSRPPWRAARLRRPARALQLKRKTIVWTFSEQQFSTP